jgi:hypothetical protein
MERLQVNPQELFDTARTVVAAGNAGAGAP